MEGSRIGHTSTKRGLYPGTGTGIPLDCDAGGEGSLSLVAAEDSLVAMFIVMLRIWDGL